MFRECQLIVLWLVYAWMTGISNSAASDDFLSDTNMKITFLPLLLIFCVFYLCFLSFLYMCSLIFSWLLHLHPFLPLPFVFQLLCIRALIRLLLHVHMILLLLHPLLMFLFLVFLLSPLLLLLPIYLLDCLHLLMCVHSTCRMRLTLINFIALVLFDEK